MTSLSRTYKSGFRNWMAEPVICNSLEETRELSVSFGKTLKQGDIVCFFGDLGAGKTTFIKGIVEGIGGYSPEFVNSPTFSYLNIYDGNIPVYHFDLYRLRDADEFLSMGFDEYLYADGVCCVEWSEKIADLIPEEAIQVNISHLDETRRSITIN